MVYGVFLKSKILTIFIATFCVSNALGSSFDKLLAKHGISKNDVAFHVVDLQSKNVERSHNADRPMILASVTKALSLFYALSVLGPQYKFKTKLYLKGKVEKGVLKGDVVLEGGGDPYLGPAHLMSIALALKEKGISKVEGRLIYNQDALPFIEKISPAILQDQPYNTSVGALNVDFNRFSALKTGGTVPLLEHLVVKKAQTKLPLGLNFKGQLNDNQEVWLYGKRSRRSSEDDLPVRNPGLFTAGYFQYLCSLMGMTLPSPQEGPVPKGLKPVYTHESLPLIRLSSLAIEYSNNMFAELPALMASKSLAGKKLGLQESSERMKSWFAGKFEEIEFKKASFSNASGLSVKNAMNARALTDVLAAIHTKSFGQRRYWSLLSINGKSGWLANRLDEPELSFRIWAKTGSLDFVNNIAGYYIDKDGNSKAFSLLLNDHNKRKLLNSPLSLKAYNVRKSAGRWSRQSRKFMDDLLKLWIENDVLAIKKIPEV